MSKVSIVLMLLIVLLAILIFVLGYDPKINSKQNVLVGIVEPFVIIFGGMFYIAKYIVSNVFRALADKFNILCS